MDIVEHLRDLKLHVAADEIERLRKELAQRPRIDEHMLKGATDTAAVIVNELRAQLAACQRDMQELNVRLGLEIGRKNDELASVTKERDEKDRQVASLYQKWTDCQRDAERYKNALHEISLCSQNSMSSQRQCGEIARAAIDAARGK